VVAVSSRVRPGGVWAMVASLSRRAGSGTAAAGVETAIASPESVSKGYQTDVWNSPANLPGPGDGTRLPLFHPLNARRPRDSQNRPRHGRNFAFLSGSALSPCRSSVSWW
jgi:hypothetical protein